MDTKPKEPLILIVDDVEDWREEIIPAALAPLKPRLVKASGVAEALLAASEHRPRSSDPFDLIVLDMRMPEKPGGADLDPEAGVRFLREYLLAECPVVVFTAWPSYDNCVAAVQAGATAYVPKRKVDDPSAAQAVGDNVDKLLGTCRKLLAKPSTRRPLAPPNDEWMERNYDWLTRNYADQWVAFVRENEAREDGRLKDPQHFPARDGWVLIPGKSRDDIVRILIQSPEVSSTFPLIVFIPASQPSFAEPEEK